AAAERDDQAAMDPGERDLGECARATAYRDDRGRLSDELIAAMIEAGRDDHIDVGIGRVRIRARDEPDDVTVAPGRAGPGALARRLHDAAQAPGEQAIARVH